MAKGQFEKGHTKATGRPKGVANKVTTSIRDKFQQLLDGYSIEQMVKDLQDIESPKDRMMIISNLSEFLVPKLSRAEVKNEVTITETQVFKIGDQTISFGE
jgi:hypothetical protein